MIHNEYILKCLKVPYPTHGHFFDHFTTVEAALHGELTPGWVC